MPRKSLLGGFSAGGTGLADTCQSSQFGIFASTEFASLFIRSADFVTSDGSSQEAIFFVQQGKK